MNEMIMSKTDELVMKLLHYFIIEEGYTPIILHGVQNEIWLENLGEEYKIVRIVSNYIHNDEQFTYDLFKTNHVMKKIKRKTLSFHMNALSIFVNLGENVKQIHETQSFHKISCIELTEIDDLEGNRLLQEKFPSITKENNFKEKGAELFIKLTMDINAKSEREAAKNEAIFSKKKVVVTYILLAISFLLFFLGRLYPGILASTVLLGKEDMGTSYIRILANIFVHYSIWHFLFNMYALYVVGSEVEGLLGKGKFLFVFLISGIAGSLLTMPFLKDMQFSLGATGAIFGILGSILYFGYYYRVYLGTIVQSQIIPLIFFYFILSLFLPSVLFAAQVGGLLAGVFATMALGIPYKTTVFEKTNGWIVLGIYLAFLLFLAFVGI